MKEQVKQLILESDGMRTNDLLYETGIPKTSLLTILSELKAKKLKSRWIPHELTQRQKQARHNIAGKHLATYQKESGFLDKIIAIDETWLNHMTLRMLDKVANGCSLVKSRKYKRF